MKRFLQVVKLCLLICTLALSLPAFAQQTIKGTVFKHGGRSVIPFVSIYFKNNKSGYSTDAEGNFAVPIYTNNLTDSIFISSVGFKTLKMPVTMALNQVDYFLEPEAKTMDVVTVKTYHNEGAGGATNEKTGYFRSWTTRSGGGEIGRMIELKAKEVKVEKVRFKINNQCDTCVIRLHIRSLNNGLPDGDLLWDSISVVTKRLAFDDRFVEFDLSNRNIIIKNKRYVFVSFETLNCRNKDSSTCNLCYIGTEDGRYMYRTRDYLDWEESAESSLYIRMYYKY